jgi:hypothetical protein
MEQKIHGDTMGELKRRRKEEEKKKYFSSNLFDCTRTLRYNF